MGIIEQSESSLKTSFTQKQEEALSALLICPTIEGAAEKANISRTSVYNWLKEPSFQEELQRRRRGLISQALNGLAGVLDKAVEEMGRLLRDTHTTPQLRRLLCKDIIEFNLKASEIEDIKARIESLEETARSRYDR